MSGNISISGSAQVTAGSGWDGAGIGAGEDGTVSGTITIDGVANAMFFSKTYVKSVFKKGTGQTIMQYFSSLKIDEAKKLISYNRYTFTEIAYRLGYSSLHYFSRQFKKSTEMTLSEYARSIKVDDVL